MGIKYTPKCSCFVLLKSIIFSDFLKDPGQKSLKPAYFENAPWLGDTTILSTVKHCTNPNGTPKVRTFQSQVLVTALQSMKQIAIGKIIEWIWIQSWVYFVWCIASRLDDVNIDHIWSFVFGTYNNKRTRKKWQTWKNTI